ncbi:MAG: hypothetical protein M3Z33_02215, partial [Actinomycetota bacterium]|nr:hypothetical protein [Actinomycetota bacterium]
MKRLVVFGAIAGLAAAGAVGGLAGEVGAAAAPRVRVMVVGKTQTLLAGKTVTARRRTVTVGRRRCTVAAGTGLAGLDAARRAGGPAYRLRDYGTCSRRAADAASLFVFEVGRDRNRGRDGWVYKIGHSVPSAGAGDPNGRRLSSGDDLTWFYCRMQRSGGCQRTLELIIPLRSAPGQTMRALVRSHDDDGRDAAAVGVTVALGAATGVTGADGSVMLTAPGVAGRYAAQAQR